MSYQVGVCDESVPQTREAASFVDVVPLPRAHESSKGTVKVSTYLLWLWYVLQ